MDEDHEVTELLARLRRGDAGAAEALLPRVYDELRALARRAMADERAGHTLQATALVHEAWVRLAGGDAAADRSAFLRVAARAMRQVLIDHARRRGALKRGGGAANEGLDAVLVEVEAHSPDVLALESALERLGAVDASLAQLVELRFFAGLTIEETARVLETSHATVERRWAMARMYLRRELGGPGAAAANPGDS